MNNPDRSVAVVGTGLMGVGIATCLALAGQHVKLFDSNPARRRDALHLVRDILDEIRQSGRTVDMDQVQARIVVCNSLSALTDAQIVYEAVVERLEVKQAVYAELETVIAPDAVIASNTSGLLPDALCANMQHAERFLVAHFWNPPHVIPLVELVPSQKTDVAIPLQIQQQLTLAGFEPIILRTAVPGFIGNRIQFAVLREALHLVQSGVADAATVDAVIRNSLGRRYARFGPLEIADLGGLDTILDIAGYLLPHLDTSQDVLGLLRSHSALGNTGVDSGQGFYVWDAQRKATARQRRLAMLADNTLHHNAAVQSGETT